MSDVLFLRIKKIISALLNRPELEEMVTHESLLRRDLGIDSLLTMDLIIMLEEEMNVMIPAQLLTAANLSTVGGIYRMMSGIITQ